MSGDAGGTGSGQVPAPVPGGRAAAPAAPVLRIEGLRTWFSGPEGVVRAVDGVSLEVREGEAVGLVGESGAGKTVIALSILGLVPSPPGRIREGSSVRWRGQELVGAPASRLRRIRGGEIGMIFQEPMTSLNPVYTVGDQVREALRLHRGLRGRRARDAAVELLDEVGIAEPGLRVDAYPHQLSGGMRQRVMIATALAGEPELLVADEPTTALDVTIQAQILELLDRLRRERGMAVLLVTHDLGVVAETCDRVTVLYAGRVVETGAAADVLASPLHPYTRGLLASVPVLGRREERLRPVPGTVPSPTSRPGGCRFRDRCPHAWERCRTEPDLLDVDGRGRARAARCWLAEEER